MNRLFKNILVLIFTLLCFRSIGQRYSSSIFHKCTIEPLTLDNFCNKTEMIDFIHKEILPYIHRNGDSAFDIKLDFTVDNNGEIFNLKVNDFVAQDLLEKTFLFKQYNNVKIPSYKYSSPVFVSYLIPINRIKDYDFKRITLLSEEREIFSVVEEMPRFPGCEDLETNHEKTYCSNSSLLNYIESNLILPEEIIKQNIKDRVVVQFIVEVDGWINNVQVLKEFGHGSAQATIDVIESMNEMQEPWIPGKQRGINVRALFKLPVNFNPDKVK